MSVRLAIGGAAVLLCAVATLGTAAPSLAAPPDRCPNPAGFYPPGLCHTMPPGKGLSDTTLVPGQTTHVHSVPPWMPDSDVAINALSTPIFLGSSRTSSAGVLDADVVIPASLPLGLHHIVEQGFAPDGSRLTISVPFTVVKAVPAAGRQGAHSDPVGILSAPLPRTGAEIAGVGVAGIVLVGAGSVAIFAGRRRRVLA